MIEDRARQKIEKLIERAIALYNVPAQQRDPAWLAQGLSWITEVLNVVELCIPTADQAYRREISRLAQVGGNTGERIQRVSVLLQAMLGDIDAGLIGNLGNKVRAETFDNFLDHALEYRKEDRKQEAGVIASVVFEDTVRKIYRDRVTTDAGQKLEDIINALTKNDVITGQQAKQAKVGSHVRAKATHAQWDEFDLGGVDATIAITKALLREHFGG
jgi:hypothetical protein